MPTLADLQAARQQAQTKTPTLADLQAARGGAALPPSFGKATDSGLLQKKHAAMLSRAEESIGGDDSNLASGVIPSLVAYGANAISQIPGLKELGSLSAASLGAGTGDTIGERYNDLQQSQQAMREAGQKAYPTATNLGKVGVNLATLGAPIGGQAKAATSFLDALKAGAKTGSKIGAAYGYSDTDSFLPTDQAIQRRLGNSLYSALFGGATGGLLGGAGYTASAKGKDFLFSNSQKPTVSSSDLKSLSQESFKKAEEIGAIINPENSSNKIADEIAKLKVVPSAKSELLGPMTDLAKEASPAQLKINNISDIIQNFKGKNMSLEDAMFLDKTLGDAAWSFTNPRTGELTSEGARLYGMQQKIRDILDEVKPTDLKNGSIEAIDAWKNGKAQWFKKIKMDEIERIIENSKDAQQPANSMRSAFNTLKKNPKRFNKYTPDEKALIKKASQSGLTKEILMSLGTRLLNIGSTVAGAAAGGIPGAIAGNLITTGIGMGARKVGSVVQEQSANKILREIANEHNPTAYNPYTQLIAPATSEYGRSK